MKKLYPLALIALALFAAGLLLTFFASVPDAGAAPGSAPADAVPVWCERENVGTGVSDYQLRPTCYRVDTGAMINSPTMTVPANYYFLVTDVLVSPESGSVASTDRFYVTIGRNNQVGEPSFELQGTFPDTAQAHFVASPVVVDAGSYLQVTNEGSDSVNQTVSVFVSGFLAPDVTYEPTAMTGLDVAFSGQPLWPQLLLLLLMAGLTTFTYRQVRAVRR